MEIGKVYSGKEFNALCTKPLVKLTNADEIHNGYRYTDGLNLLGRNKFYPKGSCNAGGLYFCEKEKLDRWISYSDVIMVYFRAVTIPDDAQVYVEDNKYKSTELMLGPRQTIFSQKQYSANFFESLAYNTSVSVNDYYAALLARDDLWVAVSKCDELGSMESNFVYAPDWFFTRELWDKFTSGDYRHSFSGLKLEKMKACAPLDTFFSRFPSDLITPESCSHLFKQGVPPCLFPEPMQTVDMWADAKGCAFEHMPQSLRTRALLEILMKSRSFDKRIFQSFSDDLFRDEDRAYFIKENVRVHYWPPVLQTREAWVADLSFSSIKHMPSSVRARLLDVDMLDVVLEQTYTHVLKDILQFPPEVLDMRITQISDFLDEHGPHLYSYKFFQLPQQLQTRERFAQVLANCKYVSFDENMSEEFALMSVEYDANHLFYLPASVVTARVVRAALNKNPALSLSKAQRALIREAPGSVRPRPQGGRFATAASQRAFAAEPPRKKRKTRF